MPQVEPRNRLAARRAIPLVEQAAKEVLARKLGTLVSQRDWEHIAVEIARTAAVIIDADHEFSNTVCGGDVLDPKGNVNAEPVLTGLRQMAENARKEGDQQRLLYLAQHFRQTMTQLRVIKECDPDGEEKKA